MELTKIFKFYCTHLLFIDSDIEWKAQAVVDLLHLINM